MAVQTADDGEHLSIRDLDGRDVAALTEYMTVLDDIGPARGAPGLYQVVSQSGATYLVDLAQESCQCEDSEFRDPEGGCKHIRRILYAEGRRVIPGDVDRSAIDPQLGEHVDGAPRIQRVGGGTEVFEP